LAGIGSGRFWHYDAKDKVEDNRSIDVRRWQRDKLLYAGKSFNWQWLCDGKLVANINVKVNEGRVTLDYRIQRNGGDWESVSEPILLATTPCNYGGVRYWFRCHAIDCGKRVAILYGAGKYFACRHCYQLAYESQREPDYDRQARRADKIGKRLEWEPGILNGDGGKPKGMHWRTFERLTQEHEKFVGKSLAGAAFLIGIIF